MRIGMLLLIAVFCFGRDFHVDQLRSVVMFEVKEFAFVTVEGSFSDFSGTVNIENGGIKDLQGIVQTRSIDTAINKRDEHLLSADFFHAKKYPQMLLSMVSMEEKHMVADLTIKDLTQRVRLNVIDKKISDAGVELVLTGVVDRIKFDLDNSLMSMMISDDVTIKLKLVTAKDFSPASSAR